LETRKQMSVAAVSHGDAVDQEFEELFREHCKLVYRTAYHITGNRQDAEDVLQTIFLKLLQKDFSREIKSNAGGYLHRSAVNLSLNVLRSRKRQKLRDGVEYLAIAGRSEDRNAGAEDDQHRQLMDAITQLRPRAVEILLLRYKHNYTDAEIAKMTGRSRGTIAVTLHRIRARLRSLVGVAAGDEGEEP
jgi:RNA polymerase sigma factor (sigma-70 family)